MTSNLLADEVVWVRALLLDDHQGLRVMFSRVSSETIYRRFHTPYPRVPEWTPKFLMDADECGGRSMIAVVVEDRWQGRGVGKLLLFELAGDFVPLPEDLEFVGAISQQRPRA